MHKADSIYSRPLKHIADFKFDEKVSDVFDDMIRRSVPGYESIIPMMGMMGRHFAVPRTMIYDLGSSLGATALSISRGLSPEQLCQIIAVDNSLPMIRRSRGLLAGLTAVPVSFICSDISDIHIRNASLVALNFTLQFIDPDQRPVLLMKIYDGLIRGGALVLSEKIRFGDAQEDAQQIALHHAYKKFHGYSDLEISQKRTALENIMKPESPETHISRLQDIGFATACQWFQCFNFVSYLAVK